MNKKAKKSQVVRVYFMDDSSKAFAITPDTDAEEFKQMVIKRIELRALDCFALFEKKDQWERCLDPEERPAELMKEWNHDDKNERFVFKKKIFLKDDDKEMQDPVAKDLVYIQAVSDVINSQYNVSLEDALRLSGLQVQVVYGDHNPTTHIKGFLTYKQNFFFTLQSDRKTIFTFIKFLCDSKKKQQQQRHPELHSKGTFCFQETARMGEFDTQRTCQAQSSFPGRRQRAVPEHM